MTDPVHDGSDITPRRGFFRRFGGAMAVGLAGLASKPLYAQNSSTAAEGPNWPGTLPGRHRQLIDAYAVNAGFPLAFAYTFLVTNESSTAFPIALGSAMWEKYKIGESFKIVDPETNAPATKNPFLRPKAGVLLVDDIAVDRLLARGVVFGGCHVALRIQSKMLARLHLRPTSRVECVVHSRRLGLAHRRNCLRRSIATCLLSPFILPLWGYRPSRHSPSPFVSSPSDSMA